MGPLSLEDAVAIEGGPLVLGSSLPGLPSLAIGEASATVYFLVRVFLNNLQDRASGIFVALTKSSGLTCRVRQLSDGASVMLVPAGMIARVRTLCRALLRYWNKESRVALLSSPLDDIPEDQWQVPPKLAPLFDQNESGELFWTHLQELDDALDLDSRFDPDVGELMHLGLVFLCCHEFAHVLFQHFEFLQEITKTKPDQVDRVRRGMELQADSFAGTWATTILLAQVGAHADAESVARGFLRQSYVVTAIMGLFDAQKKFVGHYNRGDYNHPLIRREVFGLACKKEISLKGKEYLDFWQDMELQGWKRAVDAYTDLNLDVLRGKFGKIDPNKLVAPLQALTYGMRASFGSLQKIFAEGDELLEDIKAQVAAFKKNFDASTVV